MTQPQDADKKTRDAIRACAEWLATCVRLGWERSDLDFLEGLWWKYHDNRGHLMREPRTKPRINLKPKQMWAVLHVSSGFWDHGDSKLTLYPFEHEARLACPNEAFVPILVTVAPEPK